MSDGARARDESGARPDGSRVGGRSWVARAGRRLRWLSVVLAMGALACSEPAQPPLMVGVNTWVGYDPLVLARDREAIDAQQVKVVELVSSAEAVRHLRNGLLDAAASVQLATGPAAIIAPIGTVTPGTAARAASIRWWANCRPRFRRCSR